MGYGHFTVHIIHGMELIMVTVNLALTWMILKRLKSARTQRRLSQSDLDAIDEEGEFNVDNTHLMKQKQIKLLSISLFIFTVARVIFSLIGDEYIFKQSGFS